MSKKYCIALDDYERGTIINCLGLKVMRVLLSPMLYRSKSMFSFVPDCGITSTSLRYI